MEVLCTSCGAVNDYFIKPSGLHQTAYCNKCERYIKHLPTLDARFHVGKHKGKFIKDMKSKDELSYLQWAGRNMSISESFKKAIISQLQAHNLGL